jgi:hypothetical protein
VAGGAPGPGADVAGVSPVLVQTCAGASPVPVQLSHRRAQLRNIWGAGESPAVLARRTSQCSRSIAQPYHCRSTTATVLLNGSTGSRERFLHLLERRPRRLHTAYGTVSRTAWYPVRRGIPHGTVAHPARHRPMPRSLRLSRALQEASERRLRRRSASIRVCACVRAMRARMCVCTCVRAMRVRMCVCTCVRAMRVRMRACNASARFFRVLRWDSGKTASAWLGNWDRP